MKPHRILAALLAVLLLSPVLAACGDGGSGSVTDATPPVTDSSTVTTDAETTAGSGEAVPRLAIGVEDNDGRVINILTTTHAAYEYVADAISGDIINDAVFARNLALEEQLGVDLNFIVQDGHWAQRKAFNDLISTSILAKDGAYDLVNGVLVVVLPSAAGGLFVDALTLEHTDFSNPWWVQGMEEDLAINNKLFGFVGDASLSLYKDLSVVFFNAELIETLQLDNPYDLVRNNSWTIDKLFEMIPAGASDLNGDGKVDKENDRFGYIGHTVPQRTFLTATEMKIFNRDADGYPQVVAPDARSIDIFDRINAALYDKDNVYSVDAGNSQHTFTAIFNENRALFMVNFLSATEYLRNMESDYGIVPMPKADTEQESYHTQIGTSTSTFFVPTTTSDVELISKVCETLCYYSWKDVVPTYYEVALKDKYARDPDVQEMLDIVRETAQIDFTFAYSTIFPTPYPNQVVECHPTKNTVGNSLTSFMARMTRVWEKYIDGLVDQYAALG